MRLWINKDGNQQGPYSLEEARTLVLSGQLAATDWAWVDGSAQWVLLKDVPGFAAMNPAVTAAPPAAPAAISTPASSAAATPSVSAEEELWRGRPSQILNLRIYLFWAIVLLGVLLATVIHPRVWPFLAILGALAFLQILMRNLRLRAIQYVVTTQRVRVISGLFNKDIQEIELFRVKDTMVRQWFFQRLFGLGTITVLSGDAHNPRLVLYGVPHAIALRERLRQEVMALRQRYGVREMDVM